MLWPERTIIRNRFRNKIHPSFSFDHSNSQLIVTYLTLCSLPEIYMTYVFKMLRLRALPVFAECFRGSLQPAKSRFFYDLHQDSRIQL